jgi:hypothetical protein
MVTSEANDLYASDSYIWSATSIAQGSNEEPVVNNHSPSSSDTHLESTQCASLEHFVMMVGVLHVLG